MLVSDAAIVLDLLQGLVDHIKQVREKPFPRNISHQKKKKKLGKKKREARGSGYFCTLEKKNGIPSSGTLPQAFQM